MMKGTLLFYSLAVLTSPLLLKTTAQSTSATLTRDRQADCNNRDNFYATYEENVIPGFKVLDALEAQRKLIDASEVIKLKLSLHELQCTYSESRKQSYHNYLAKFQIRPMFRPQFPGYETVDQVNNVISAVKSLIELVTLKEKYQALNTSPQFALVHLLFTKLAEDSCKWVSVIKQLTNCTDKINYNV